MEYAPNGSLKKVILEQFKKFEEFQRRCIIADILLGISAMHKSNVAHRDLKPDNILLSFYNRMKICDFGEAKKFSVDGLRDLARYVSF